MKPWVTILLVLLGCSLLENSCEAAGQRMYENRKLVEFDTGFHGKMDTTKGYENIPWGTQKQDISTYGNYPYTDYDTYVVLKGDIHEGVTQTGLYFYKDCLYQTKDIIPEKNTTLEYLHNRYGAFSEVNVASEMNKEKGYTVYTNRDSFNKGDRFSLYIEMIPGQPTTVRCVDYLTMVTVIQFEDNVKSFQFNQDAWYSLASTDEAEQMEHYYFVKKNSDDEYVVLNYNRSMLSENRSTVRAGFTLGYGDYEIKINGNIQKKNYSNTQLKDSFYNLRWEINYSTESSSREMLDLILKEQPIQIRKSNTVYTFNTYGIHTELSKFGISMEELDYALSNEEF